MLRFLFLLGWGCRMPPLCCLRSCLESTGRLLCRWLWLSVCGKFCSAAQRWFPGRGVRFSGAWVGLVPLLPLPLSRAGFEGCRVGLHEFRYLSRHWVVYSPHAFSNAANAPWPALRIARQSAFHISSGASWSALTSRANRPTESLRSAWVRIQVLNDVIIGLPYFKCVSFGGRLSLTYESG
jgi:hypothetical protein